MFSRRKKGEISWKSFYKPFSEETENRKTLVKKSNFYYFPKTSLLVTYLKNSFDFKRDILQRLPLTHVLKAFFSLVWCTSINRYNAFYALSKRRFYPCFLSTQRNMSAFKPFCNILLQDLTPLHVKITRSTNLLNVCHGETQIIDLLTNCKLQLHKFSQYTLADRLFWVLASCGFCWITWRIMIM